MRHFKEGTGTKHLQATETIEEDINILRKDFSDTKVPLVLHYLQLACSPVILQQPGIPQLPKIWLQAMQDSIKCILFL